MSVLGQASKYGKEFKDKIQNAAMQGFLDHEGGLAGTRKICGYVCAIHGPEDKNEELRNTIDVQEYGYDMEDHHDKEGYYPGFHEGVLLCAIQENNNGVLIVPRMYSEVIIMQDPVDMKEYVYMYNHAKLIRLWSTEDAEIGVIETEDFDENDESGPDVDELPKTKNKAVTKYNKDHIYHEVTTKGDFFTDETTATKRKISVNDTTIIVIDGNSVTIESSDDITLKANNVTITGGNLNTKGISNIDQKGPYNAVTICPYSGVPHCGSMVSKT